MKTTHFPVSRPGQPLGVLTVLFGLAAPFCLGAGFFLPNQSTEATARGNAWVATADSAAAVYYNPAGLVQLDSPSVESGLYAIRLGHEMDLDIDGRHYEAKRKGQVVPHLYYAQPVGERMAFGIGINSPFGLGSEWGNDTPFRLVTTEALLKYIRASAVLSFQVTDSLSVGFGGGLDYADAQLEQGIGFFPGDNLRFDGTGMALTWSAGLLWTPHQDHSFGLVYRSVAEFTLDGDVSSVPVGMGLPAGDAKTDFLTPASAAIGYAWRPTDRLTIEANVEWVDWDSLNTLTLRGSGMPAPSPLPFEWTSTFIYEIGFSYQINERYTLHAGYDYNESAQPDLFYNPAVSDSDFHYLNVGINRETEHLGIQLGYQFGFSDQEISNSVFPVNGDYSPRHHAVMASVRWDF